MLTLATLELTSWPRIVRPELFCSDFDIFEMRKFGQNRFRARRSPR